MVTLPANLPSIAHAKLPAMYESARTALAECSRIDECAEWANKAEALASYAKQAEDDTLRKTADRIQARAIRRCGQLLQEFRPAPGTRIDLEPRVPGHPRTITELAMDARMSGHQRKQALRVARIPTPDFEAAVESDDPPTVTRLAEQGKAKPLVDLKGRDPKEYAIATQALGLLRRFEEFTEQAAPAVVARGASKKERTVIAGQARAIGAWLTRLVKEIDA